MTGARICILFAIITAGCLQFEEVDLFPVCEDRRQQGPSPTYTVDELRRKVAFPAGEPPEADARALLEAVRLRVLTLQAAPYAAFEANLTPEGEDAWRFRARGTGGLDPATDDAYGFRVTLRDGAARAEAPPGLPHPVPAPDTLGRRGLDAFNATPEMDEVRARTPRLVSATLDPDLPACLFLAFEAEEGAARSEVAVNLVRELVVHVEKDGW